MSGIIVSIAPSVEVPPGNNASNPTSLPPVTYQFAVLNFPQTWGAKQTFPLGGISANAADINFLQTGTGAISRSMLSKASDTINALDFGAKFDGVTDDTTAIAAAIAATPSGGTLVLPAGNTLISGSGSQIFTITTPINIIGAGSSVNGGIGTTLLMAAGVPSTRDLFHITGATNSALRGYSFRNFNVGIVSGSGGRHVFHFDTSAGTTTGFAEVVIDNVYMPSAVTAGGNSVLLNNNIGTNTNGGTFNFTVQNSFIGGGVNFVKAGDTLRVLNNIITGPAAGITSDQVAGAGQLIVLGNNITSAGGAVIVAQGISPLIAFNQIESGTTTEANNALIDIMGSVANISSPKIINNQIQGISGTPTLIRVAAAVGAYIDGNRLGTASAYAHIVNSSVGLILGLGNTFTGGGANITDSGTLTIDPTSVWVTFTPSFGFTGGTGVSATSPVGSYKLVGKTLTWRAQATITYTGAPTAIAVTLPASLVGIAAAAQNCLVYNNFNGTMGVAQIAAGGSTASAATGLPTASGQPFVLSGSIEVQ